MSPDIVDGKGLFAENRFYKFHLFLISSKYSLTRNLIYCVFQNRRWILSFEERFGKKSDVSKGIRN